jgi:sulfite reductase (NADPH) hemoprotein beta-component
MCPAQAARLCHRQYQPQAIGGIPGDASAEQIELMADLAERYSFDELRVTHAQNIVLPHVAKADLYALWQALEANGLATPTSIWSATSSPAPASIIAALANARSIPVAQKIAQRFAERQGSRDRRAEAQDLGLHQRLRPPPRRPHRHPRRRPQGHGELPAAARWIGRGGLLARQITGPGFDENGIVDAVEKATDLYLAQRTEGERFLDTYRRLGMAPFKEAIYG